MCLREYNVTENSSFFFSRKSRQLTHFLWVQSRKQRGIQPCLCKFGVCVNAVAQLELSFTRLSLLCLHSLSSHSWLTCSRTQQLQSNTFHFCIMFVTHFLTVQKSPLAYKNQVMKMKRIQTFLSLLVEDLISQLSMLSYLHSYSCLCYKIKGGSLA